MMAEQETYLACHSDSSYSSYMRTRQMTFIPLLWIPLAVPQYLHRQEDRVNRWVEEHDSEQREGKVVQLRRNSRGPFGRSKNCGWVCLKMGRYLFMG